MLDTSTKMKTTSSNEEDNIYCPECNFCFSLIDAKPILPTLPNTLTDLPDYQNPKIECPNCGLVF